MFPTEHWQNRSMPTLRRFSVSSLEHAVLKDLPLIIVSPATPTASTTGQDRRIVDCPC